MLKESLNAKPNANNVEPDAMLNANNNTINDLFAPRRKAGDAGVIEGM